MNQINNIDVVMKKIYRNNKKLTNCLLIATTILLYPLIIIVALCYGIYYLLNKKFKQTKIIFF